MEKDILSIKRTVTYFIRVKPRRWYLMTPRMKMKFLRQKKMLQLLVHCTDCRLLNCQYTNCGKVKRIFHHGTHCKIHFSGGCVLCKKMWYLLQLHARACKESECRVPLDLKEHMQQPDFPRRDTVMRMMKERRAKDFASGS